MVAISQIDLLQGLLILLAAILGFLSASVANILKDWVDRRRLRKALYFEIIAMFEALKETAEDLKKNISNSAMTWNERYARFRLAYGYLKDELSADTYRYARATPALFRGIKDVESIDKVYHTFGLFNVESEALGIKTTLPLDPMAQSVLLKTVCEAYLNALKNLFISSTLDKKMLLKAAGVASSKEYWEKLLEGPLPEAQRKK